MSAQSTRVLIQPSLDRNATLRGPRGLSRWSRAIVSACVGVAAITVSAAPAAAQWRVGGFVGGEHESSWEKFLVIGADARGPVGARSFEINPRVSYFLRDATTRFQVDLNVIKPLILQSKSRIVPFVGTGVALESVSYDGDVGDGSADQTNVGFNYIVGGTLSTSKRVEPYAQFVYTVLNDSPNNAVISVGVHYKLGKSK